MKAVYFVRPIFRMFDFKGRTGRTEYFAYTIASQLTLFSIVAIALAEMRNGALHLTPGLSGSLSWMSAMSWQLLALAIWNFPMLALTMRRLRDQRASIVTTIWLFLLVPTGIGVVALLFYGFVPTFHDRFVQRRDGTTALLSEVIDERRMKLHLIGFGVVLVSFAMVSAFMGDGGESVGSSSASGRRGRVTGRPFKADGSINNRNNILGGRRAHMRGGSPVKASHNKYTWN